MQNLGLAGGSARSDSRLKSLFWPSIHNESDVNSLGQQGLWREWVSESATGSRRLLSSLFTYSDTSQRHASPDNVLVRATWISSKAAFSATEFDRDRLNETFADKISDQWPRLLWPKLKWLFWFLAVLECFLLAFIFWKIRHL